MSKKRLYIRAQLRESRQTAGRIGVAFVRNVIGVTSKSVNGNNMRPYGRWHQKRRDRKVFVMQVNGHLDA